MQITTNISTPRALAVRPSAERRAAQEPKGDSVTLSTPGPGPSGPLRKAAQTLGKHQGVLLAGALGVAAGVVISAVSGPVSGVIGSFAAPVLGIAGMLGGAVVGAHAGLSLSEKYFPGSLGLLDSGFGAAIGAMGGAAAGFFGGGLLSSAGGLGSAVAVAATLGTVGSAGALARAARKA